MSREIVLLLALTVCMTSAAPGHKAKVKHTYQIEVVQNSGSPDNPTWVINGDDPEIQDLVKAIHDAGENHWGNNIHDASHGGHGGHGGHGLHGGHGAPSMHPSTTPYPFPDINGYRGMYITHMEDGKPMHKTPLPLCTTPRLHWQIVARTAGKHVSDGRKVNIRRSLLGCLRKQWKKDFQQQRANQASTGNTTA